MTKILTLFLISLVTLTLCGCKKEIDLDYKHDIIDYMYSKYNYTSYENGYINYRSCDLFDIYKEHLLSNVDIYEAEVVDKSEIAGYIKKTDMELIVNKYDSFEYSFDIKNNRYMVDGAIATSDILDKYQRLYNNTEIEHYKTYLYPLEFENPYYMDDLVFLYAVRLFSVKLNDGTNFLYTFSVKGMPTKDYFYAYEDEHNFIGKYIKIYKPEFFINGLNTFRYTSIKVEQYNGVEAIKFISYGSDEINK